MTELSADRVYAETCADIRATDDISFKLMGIVPLVSGATLLTFFLKEPISANKAALVVSLALFAALITLGLFRWALRNIQNCSWLKRRAEALENVIVATSGATRQPKPPLKIGKTEAEKWIYSFTILAWLSIPPLVSPLERSPCLLGTYVASAVLIAALTVVSAVAPVRVERTTHHSASDDAYPSFERTCPGVPAQAAQLKRWASGLRCQCRRRMQTLVAILRQI